jgi:hypothetical protein
MRVFPFGRRCAAPIPTLTKPSPSPAQLQTSRPPSGSSSSARERRCRPRLSKSSRFPLASRLGRRKMPALGRSTRSARDRGPDRDEVRDRDQCVPARERGEAIRERTVEDLIVLVEEVCAPTCARGTRPARALERVERDAAELLPSASRIRPRLAHAPPRADARDPWILRERVDPVARCKDVVVHGIAREQLNRGRPSRGRRPKTASRSPFGKRWTRRR